MEKLISHLQQTLDEDEAAKEALLLLRSHGSAENANIQTTAVNLPSIDVRLFDEVFDSRSSMFILQSITSKIIEDSITNLDLPVKVAAMQLQIPPKLLLEICFIENTSTPWPHNFVSCFWRVLEVCKSSIDRGMLFFSLEQFRKLQELFTEVERIRSGPRGAGKK